jgi:hypothetical protein
MRFTVRLLMMAVWFSAPAVLLEGLHRGEAVRFTIDVDQRVIVSISPVPALPAPAQQRWSP